MDLSADNICSFVSVFGCNSVVTSQISAQHTFVWGSEYTLHVMCMSQRPSYKQNFICSISLSDTFQNVESRTCLGAPF